MHYNEVMKAIEEVKEEAGLNNLDSDIVQIEKEILSLTPNVLDAERSYNRTFTSIENEITMAKIDGLRTLLGEKYNKEKLDLNLSASFIMKMVEDPDIKYDEMIKTLVITFLRIQEGEVTKKEAMTNIKGSLANIFIKLHGMSKNKAGQEAAEMADYYFDPEVNSRPFNAKKPGKSTVTYTNFGNQLKLP